MQKMQDEKHKLYAFGQRACQQEETWTKSQPDNIVYCRDVKGVCKSKANFSFSPSGRDYSLKLLN